MLNQKQCKGLQTSHQLEENKNKTTPISKASSVADKYSMIDEVIVVGHDQKDFEQGKERRVV